ncbi:endonuclease/exonuclease/phosphatase family protein [Niabella aquatica]
MKHFLLGFLLLLFLFSCKKEKPVSTQSQPEDDTALLIHYNKNLIIANWNIEWFGDAAYFKSDLDRQENNVGKVLKYLDADLYGLCEIVDTVRLGRMIRTYLGSEFRYVVSYFTGGTQKLAFAYNKNIFRNITVRPFMGVSTQAYYNFGNRYPYLLNADVAVNGVRKNISLILIHAKANTDNDSYNRRQAGAIELKDSLDTYFRSGSFIILGDFNDNFDKSITPGKVTPYQVFLNDSARYHAITWPLNIPGNQSSLGFANSVIDQQIISCAMTRWYVTALAKVRTDVINVVPDYTTGSTSDHYPVSSIYKITP